MSGTRIPILDLDLSQAQFSGTTISNIRATLTPGTDKRLNIALGVTLFKPGMSIGTMLVRSP